MSKAELHTYTHELVTRLQETEESVCFFLWAPGNPASRTYGPFEVTRLPSFGSITVVEPAILTFKCLVSHLLFAPRNASISLRQRLVPQGSCSMRFPTHQPEG